MTNQLTFGTQITSSADPLRPVSTLDIFRLVTADAALQASTERLRSLRAMDKEAYRTVKTRLPYIVGSTFRAGSDGVAVRRTETFAAAHYFVLDLDDCPGLAGCVPEAIRQDDRVELAFVSPSGQGLKLFFRLADPCDDARQFSTAYRQFASQVGVQYRWTSSIDLRTSDVTRACFLAHDASAYHNPDAFPVDWRLWLSEANQELSLFVDEPGQPVTTAIRPAAERPINEAGYRDVLKQISGRVPVRRERMVTVPDELYALEPTVRQLCQQLNWDLLMIERLNYGLKFGIRQGFRSAEINVFYGKRGYSLVRSPKTGTDPTLADLLYNQLFGLLFPEPVVSETPISVCMN